MTYSVISKLNYKLVLSIQGVSLSLSQLTLQLEHGAVSNMEKAKSSESPERAIAKNEKTYQKIKLTTFDKRGKQEAKPWWRRFTQYIKMTQNIH